MRVRPRRTLARSLSWSYPARLSAQVLTGAFKEHLEHLRSISSRSSSLGCAGQRAGHILTQRLVTLVFVWSHMRVVDEVKRRVRLTNQDFIESQLVRVVACSSEPSSLRLLLLMIGK